MSAIILSLIPTVIKALVGTKDAPKVADAIGVSFTASKNGKALFAALLGVLAYHGIEVPPEYATLFTALWVVVGGYVVAFLVSKSAVK